MEPLMDKPLTEEQKQEIKKLHRKYLYKSALLGAVSAISILFANFIIVLLNYTWVNSEWFLFIGTMLTAIMFLKQMQDTQGTLWQDFIEEVKTIANK